MYNNESKNIADLYYKANKNKHDIAISDEEGRDFSKAELTVLACLAIVAREAEMSKLPYLPKEVDYDKVIKTLVINSLDGMTDGLKKKEEYDRIIESYKRIEPGEAYGATIVYKSMEDNFAKYLDPTYKEEVFVYENLHLRNLIRQGHIYWGAKGERLESILEHIYGCLVIAVGLESEFGYKIDFNKLYKMLLIHETGEISEKGDMTEWDASVEDRLSIEKRAANSVFSKLSGGQKLYDLWEEFNSHVTLESEYAYLIDKLEYDLQVKAYEDSNRYDFSNYPKNVVTESERVQNIINNGAKSVFDVHYEYDKNKFIKFPSLRRILEEARANTYSNCEEIDEKPFRYVVPHLSRKKAIYNFY